MIKLLLTFTILLSFAQSQGNPYDQNTHEYFVNPHFEDQVDASQTLSQSEKDQIRLLAAAFWVDTYSVIQQKQPSLKTLLAAASEKQKTSSKKITVTFIHYDLPNRDCAAHASNGEICCSGNPPNPSTGDCDSQSYNSGDCSKGLAKYRNYTDSIVNVLKQFPNIEIVAIVQPDSLPNLATNLGVEPHCTQTTKQGYIEGTKYAITQLATIPNLSMYIDAAHGGWLGWCGSHPCGSDNQCGGYKCYKGYCECTPGSNNNAQKYVAQIRDLFSSVGSAADKVRGFATNVANYQPLGYPDDVDPCDLKSQYNFAFNELRYIDNLDMLFKHAGINKYWITDTGRNGNVYVRTSPHACQQWCNVKGRLGRVPSSNVSDVQSKLTSAKLDAVAWLKTPGESDGCSPGSGISCTRVDSMCQRDCYEGYQMCPSPQAGLWNDQMIKTLMSGWTPNQQHEEVQ